MPIRSACFTANMALLKKNHPRIFEKIADPALAPTGEISFSANGQANLLLGLEQNPLHDMVDQANDVLPLLSLVPPDAKGVAVLFGLGLGHAAIALLQERPFLHYLAVFEIDPGVFLQALRHVDLAALLSSPKVLLSVGPIPDLNILGTASRALALENIYTLRHLRSYAAQDGYHDLEAVVMEHLSSSNVEGATSVHFGRLFFTNRFRHLSAIHHQHLIETLENAFVDVPAILVAGGPSLDKNIHLLKEAQGKAIILGVDSVLPALLKAGVRPDFLSSVDPQELTYEKLANTPLAGLSVPLICMSWISPKVPKTFPARTVFWTFSAKPVEVWLNGLLGGSILTGGAGTVAHLNMLAAIIMGCSPIILVGQDLSYRPNQSHTSNAFLTHDLKARTYQDVSDHLFTVAAWGGGEIQTTRDFFGMKSFFERMMSDSPRTYINATEGGIHLDGAEDLPLQSALKKYCRAECSILSVIEDHCSHNKPNIERLLQEFGKVRKTVKNLLALIEKTDRTTRTAMRELQIAARNRQTPQTFSQLSNPLRKKIKEIDVAHKTIDEHTQLWQALEELTMEGLRQAERLRHEIAPLANNPATYVDWLQKNLVRCEEINKIRAETLCYLDTLLAQVIDHHEQEEKILAAIMHDGETQEHLSSLTSLYMQSDDLTLASPILEKLAIMEPITAETRFRQGVIALERAEYDQGDRLMTQALALDQDYAERVAKLRHELGDRYLKHASFYQFISPPTSRRLLLKGLRYCAEHSVIIAQLLALYQKDSELAVGALEQNDAKKSLEFTSSWLQDAASNSSLHHVLGNDELANLHQIHGKSLAAQGLHNEAIDHLCQAAELVPLRAELHIQLMELLFNQQEFQDGISQLQKAIAIDRQFASYWEQIGDSLALTGMHQDAIRAYEQCFIALPDHIELLKKIGDCYVASNQLEAARSTYEQYKKILEKN